MEFRPTEASHDVLASYEGLFRRCFPTATTLNSTYLKWLYLDNPAGTVVGFDAWEGNVLAAHYVCVPAAAIINGRPSKLLLSLNTATHPDFQGKGLFTKLADLTYERGAAEGFSAVYGVANANSTPGFLRKLGFSLISPLDAKVGVGSVSRPDQGGSEADCSFKRIWAAESVAWRISNPERPYSLVRSSNGLVGAEASTGKPGLMAWAEIPQAGAGVVPVGRASLSLRLHLGLRPTNERHSGAWFEIPKRFRPSPLNLIFRSLGGEPESLDPNRISMGQLDFDAF